MAHRVAVSSADFIRNIGYWQGEALRQPIAITHHGRERLILAAPDHIQSSAASSTAQAELTLLRSMSALVLENMDEGFLRFDAQLQVQSANSVAEAFIGRARETLMGRTVFEALPGPLASVLAERLQRVTRTGKSEAFECGAFEGRHVNVRVFPLPEGAGVLMQNVTEKHAMRREREDMAALECAVRAHAGVSTIRLDARGRIESADESFCAWTGFWRDDLIGHRFADLAAGAARRELAGMLERVLRDNGPERLELTLLSKRGEDIRVQGAAAPILTDFIARGVRAILTLAGRPGRVEG